MHKGLVRLICCFIPSANTRHRLHDKYCPKRYDITGDNNVICFEGMGTTKFQSGLLIKIVGNNNKVFLPAAHYFHNSHIIIRANDTEIHIGKPRGKIENFGVAMSCGNGQRLIIGEDFTCFGCSFQMHETGASVKIGNDCLFSNSISIWATDGHSLLDAKTNKILNPITNAIEIGNHVWIGEGVKILKNVHIADNSVVGAASVVCKRFDTPNVTIAGNPARVIRDAITWDRLSPESLNKQRNGNK